MYTMPKRKMLTLSDTAADFLPKLAGYHDQGAYVSQLITAAAIEAQLLATGDLVETLLDQVSVQDDYQIAFAQAQDADLGTLRRLVRKLIRDVATHEQEIIRLKEQLLR